MYSDIDEFVSKCQICLKGGKTRINTKNRISKVDHPNELWVIDLIVRIPGKNNSNNFILVAIDHYAKWIETAVLQSKEAIIIRNCIKRLILDKHGILKG